jgi:anaerobic ribonucleoside-triphosphate reductase activating protein
VLNLHAILPCSRVNGPGNRTVIWVQGCSLRCPGCFNPATHAAAPRFTLPVEELVRLIQQDNPHKEGITISGGEPLEQAPELWAFLRGIRERTQLSVVLFTGFVLEELRDTHHGPDIMAHVDVLITGRFIQEQRLSSGMRGSANQEIHLITDRYRHADITDTPPAEISIDTQGMVRLSGVDPLDLSRCGEFGCSRRVR